MTLVLVSRPTGFTTVSIISSMEIECNTFCSSGNISSPVSSSSKFHLVLVCDLYTMPPPSCCFPS
uniref:Uncharacterized protein n=1 Tax=Anguilla anguilla TaxID=7936 RepID=A0A0E9QRW4_ANGAN